MSVGYFRAAAAISVNKAEDWVYILKCEKEYYKTEKLSAFADVGLENKECHRI